MNLDATMTINADTRYNASAVMKPFNKSLPFMLDIPQHESEGAEYADHKDQVCE